MKLTKEYLTTLSSEIRKKEIIQEYIKCKLDIRYCIETYFTVLVGTTRKPFILFPHQVDMLNSYEQYSNNLTQKSRQMGLTTGTSAWSAHKVIFNNNYKIVIISKTQKDSKDFLRLIKDILNEARDNFPWLVPNYMEGYNNKESITLTNGSLIKAESA